MTRGVADAKDRAVVPPRLPSLGDPPIVLDGGMGTALAAAGLPADALPEEWLLSRPDDVAAVHRAHAAAGARILLTCTFNTASPRLASRGLDERAAGTLCSRAVEIARGAGPGVLVAGAVGPTGLVRAREQPPTPRALEEAYARPFRALAGGGADLLWAETQWDLGEARAALAAARRMGLPAVVTMAFVRAGEMLATPAGDPADDCLRMLVADGAAAVGVNCTFADAHLAELIRRVAPALGVAVVAKPSPGLPGAVADPDSFADALAALARAGARLIGGCCGATAAHVAAVARRL